MFASPYPSERPVIYGVDNTQKVPETDDKNFKDGNYRQIHFPRFFACNRKPQRAFRHEVQLQPVNY